MAELSVNTPAFLADGGEMGTLTRAKDWSKTSLGPVEQWPQSLRTTLSIILNSKFPMFLWWGPDLICFYNDAYRPSLGKDGKHPSILGAKGREAWSEIWHIIGSLVDGVMAGGEATWNEDMLVPIYRNGHIEDVYWTFSYSPVKNEDGAVCGVLVACTETTSKVYAFRSLEEANRRFLNNIMQAPVAICVLRGNDFTVEIANEKMIELWGKPKEQMMNNPLFVGLPEAKGQGIEQLLEQVFTTGERFVASERPVDLPRNGKIETTYLNFIYEALREPDGTISGIMATASDVTTQYIARRRVEESEARFRSLVENAPFPIAVYIGEEMRIDVANQSILDIWGKGNNVTGKLFTDVLSELGSQQVFEQIKEVYHTGEDFHIKNQRLDLIVDGKPRIYYFNYSFTALTDNEGHVFGVMNTGVDLTDLNIAKQKVEESEKRFRRVADNAPVMIWMTDTEGVATFLNKAWTDFTGHVLEPGEGNKWFEDVHPDDLQNSMAIYKKAFDKREEFYLEYRLKRYDGQYRWVSSKGAPRVTNDGIFEGYIGGCMDIQDQKAFASELEKQVKERTTQLKRKNEELEEKNKELQSFAYVSSHDMQEPLRKIQTFAGLVLQNEYQNLSDTGKTHFNRMHASAAKMQLLINDLLSYSRTSSSEGKFENIALTAIIDSVKEDLKEEMLRKNAVIETTGLGDIKVIPFQFRQLLNNLFSNSLKFSKNGGPVHIDIKGEIISGPQTGIKKLKLANEYWHITIQDNGIGFEPEYKSKIFEVFQRLHPDSVYPGTGIGLAIVKKIIENHNGYISASGELGQGATFDIYLPVE